MLVAPEVSGNPKPRILVVEDNYLTAEAICEMVVKCGCDVAAAVGHVESGVRYLSENRVDGAVVDLELHGVPSFPICTQLQQHAIPFVFVTGYDRTYAVPAEFGETPWLSKPIDNQQFESVLAGFGKALPAGLDAAGRGNLILEGLSASSARWLALSLERVPLEKGQVLETATDEISHVHFPAEGLVSLMAPSPRKRWIEVGVVGREGATGLGVLLGSARGETEAIVQNAGWAWRIATPRLTQLLKVHRELHMQLLAAVRMLLGQMAQNIVAIGYGTIEQRLARRLLMAATRLDTRRLSITHDALARMLGVRRSGITVALHMLESRRVIRSKRNFIEIADPQALAREAGEDCPLDPEHAARIEIETQPL
jgi:CRP-like cAMP-binding protein